MRACGWRATGMPTSRCSARSTTHSSSSSPTSRRQAASCASPFVLICAATLVSAFALRGTNCCREDPPGKNVTLVVGGCLYLLSRVPTLVPVSWTHHTIIRGPLRPTGAGVAEDRAGTGAVCGLGIGRGAVGRRGADAVPIRPPQQEGGGRVCLHLSIVVVVLYCYSTSTQVHKYQQRSLSLVN